MLDYTKVHVQASRNYCKNKAYLRKVGLHLTERRHLTELYIKG